MEAGLPWDRAGCDCRVGDDQTLADPQDTVAVAEAVGPDDLLDRHAVALGDAVEGVAGLDNMDATRERGHWAGVWGWRRRWAGKWQGARHRARIRERRGLGAELGR